MAYLTDTFTENYNHLKETLVLLIKNYDWKALHCQDPKSLQSRVAVIRNAENELNKIEKQFKIELTKKSDLSLEAVKKRSKIN